MTLFKLCKPYRNKQMVTYLVDTLNPRGIDNWHQFKIQENSHAHFGWKIILSYVIDTKLDARGEKGEVVGGGICQFPSLPNWKDKKEFWAWDQAAIFYTRYLSGTNMLEAF